MILNFKTITRENNPKTGTIVGQSKNIPGEHSVVMKTVEAYDRNGRKYFQIMYLIKTDIQKVEKALRSPKKKKKRKKERKRKGKDKKEKRKTALKIPG